MHGQTGEHTGRSEGVCSRIVAGSLGLKQTRYDVIQAHGSRQRQKKKKLRSTSTPGNWKSCEHELQVTFFPEITKSTGPTNRKQVPPPSLMTELALVLGFIL